MKLLIISILLLFTTQQTTKYGIASYYAKKFEGRKTANGEIYRGSNYTAASNTLPFNTIVLVKNIKNDSIVVVRINDRMAKWNKRLIDLSRIAAKKLNFDGITRVSVTVLNN